MPPCWRNDQNGGGAWKGINKPPEHDPLHGHETTVDKWTNDKNLKPVFTVGSSERLVGMFEKEQTNPQRRQVLDRPHGGNSQLSVYIMDPLFIRTLHRYRSVENFSELFGRIHLCLIPIRTCIVIIKRRQQTNVS